MSLRERIEAEFMRLIVLLDEVEDDGSGLPEGKSCIWILDG